MNQPWLTIYVQSLWATLLDMAPFLLLGFFVAGILAVFISENTIRRHLGSGAFGPVVKASFFGVPLPLCSCGVIPVMASLRRSGANQGATTAFLISTPQTGVDSILVTYGLLGLPFTVFRVLAAFISGLLGGWAVSAWGGKDELPGNPPPEASCCDGGPVASRRWGHAFHHGFVVLPRDIANSLLVGVLVAALIAAVIPPDFFTGGYGTGFGSKLVMLLVGIPVYVCATSTVPVAAALIAVGVSPGTALVLLMSGPATNAATVSTVVSTMGRRVAILYLAGVAITSLLSGVLFDAWFSDVTVGAVEHVHGVLPGPLRAVAAVALVALLVGARYGKALRGRKANGTASL